jgi:hypothetical protein
MIDWLGAGVACGKGLVRAHSGNRDEEPGQKPVLSVSTLARMQRSLSLS